MRQSWIISAWPLAALLLMQFSSALNVADPKQCPPLPKRTSPPKDIRDLRVDDIKVIMSMGDSITAGFGARVFERNSTRYFDEFRGLSYAIGGDEGAVTLANHFKVFQPQLIGASHGQHIIEFCFGKICPSFKYYPEVDNLNAAQSGALTENLMEQVTYLKQQLQSHPNIDFDKDWKLLTLQIGSNEVCRECELGGPSINPFSPDKYETKVRAALEWVRNNIPRVFVNIVGNFDIPDLRNYSAKPGYCKTARAVMSSLGPVMCPCGLTEGLLGNIRRKRAGEIAIEFNQRLQQIAEGFESIKDPNFAVTTHIFDTQLGGFPPGALSNIDCFHPSESTHAFIAKHIWNWLMVPVAERPKVLSYEANPTIRCPTGDDRLQAN